MTPEPLDDLLQQHLRAEGDRVSAAPDSWERLQKRLDDAAPAGHSPASRGWLLVVAAAVAGFGGLATAYTMLNDRSNDGDDTVRTESASDGESTDPPPDSTADAGPSPPGDPTHSPSPAEANRPEAAIAVTASGDLVRVNVTTGQIEVLVPGTPPDDGQAVELSGVIDHAASGLDGTVLFSTCCEPAPGEIYRLEPDGSHTRLSDGYNPSISPNGTRYALVEPSGVALHSFAEGLVHRIDAGTVEGSVVTVAWAPDGDTLAVEVALGVDDTRIMLLPAMAAGFDEATTLQPPAGRWWSDPVIRSDGSLLVIEHIGNQESTVLRRISSAGSPGDAVDLDGSEPSRLAANRTGDWIIVATNDGGLLTVGPSDIVRRPPVELDDGIADLAW